MRLLNRPLALVLALALAATGVIIAIEVVAYALNANTVVVPWTRWEHWAQATHWNREVVKVWAVILMVIGLVVLLTQLKPRRVTRLPLTGHHDNTDVAMTRKGLAGAVRAAVLDVDGVAKAETAVSRRSVRVQATTSARDPETAAELTDPVTDAAQAQITALNLKHRLRVRTSVQQARS